MITQGTVFCCAQATRYDNCDVKGLVITARCDVKQNKFPVLNYLPIVSLPDWLRLDGLDILIDNETKKQRGELHRFLKEKGLSSTLVEAVPLDAIATEHFQVDQGAAAQKKMAQRFRAHISAMTSFSSIIKGRRNDIYTWFCTNRTSDVQDLIQRLSRHSVLGYYFFETLDPRNVDLVGFVCLLREVRVLSKSIAECLGFGITQAKCNDICGRADGINLSFAHEDLAMPIAELGSPGIEHVLQTFSNLFGRIGVPDPVDEEVKEIVRVNVHEQRTIQ